MMTRRLSRDPIQNDLSPPSFGISSGSLSHKCQSKDDSKQFLSKISADKIRSYFGEVKHNIISEEIPCDRVDCDSVITIMLNHFAKDDLLSVSSLEDFKACLKKDVPHESVDQRFDILVDTFTILLRRIMESANQAMTRRDFYAAVLKTVKDVSKMICADLKQQLASESLKHLLNVCEYEVGLYGDHEKKSKKDFKVDESNTYSHSLWRNFWCSLLNPILSIGHISDNPDDDITVNMELNGNCETSVEIIPDYIYNKFDNSASSGSKTLHPLSPVEITLKPDFAIYTKFGQPAGSYWVDKRQLCVIGEIKTTYHDGEVNPKSDSSDSAEKNKTSKPTGSAKPKGQKRHLSTGDSRTTVSKKHKTNHDQSGSESTSGDGGDLPGNERTSGDAGDQPVDHDSKSYIKRNILYGIKTEHFMQLFGMLRHGLMNSKYRGTKKMFGLYMVMNKAYFTCLILSGSGSKDIARLGAFVCNKNASDFHEANNAEPNHNFQTTVLPPLNIFIPAHFKAFLTFLKFLVWSESRKISTTV